MATFVKLIPAFIVFGITMLYLLSFKYAIRQRLKFEQEESCNEEDSCNADTDSLHIGNQTSQGKYNSDSP